MSASVATRVSAIRCHHDADEVRDAVKFDRLRLMATYSRLYSVACDCCVNNDCDEENCRGLRVYNGRGNPVAVFRGTQYRAIENANGIAVYSTLVRC